MKKGSQLTDWPRKILGWYSETSIWKKLSHHNYGKNITERKKGTILTDKFNEYNLAKEVKKSAMHGAILWNTWNLNSKYKAQERYIRSKFDAMFD